ncbi:Hsp70 family protein [Micromonospora sp. NBC_01813]|uniref:Hsp70 family protein n=1 Tax=Micromonospora sp. NBC_01813 TaxID=2975988 RepID=UPI002DDBE9FB|nr:Hsp70 family protein [Micromonospora sp. NBC_01813]WSA09259.1 Hsp70 family protein [Micromonospora sp. NBC_01813]
MAGPGYMLGVDFGTSHTVAAARSPDNRSRVLLFDGSPLLPSAVYAQPGAPLLVGRDAILAARVDPARFEPHPKRRVDDGTVLLGEREFPVVDLIAAVYRRVGEEWGRVVGAVRPELTLTHPAAWGEPRRRVLVAAAEAAGFDRIRLVPEPVAAAAYFVRVLGQRLPTGSVLVVHDIGGGTVDVAAVTRTRTGFTVSALDGRDDLGGIDLDAAVVAHLSGVHGTDSGGAWHRLTTPANLNDRRARRLLWDDVRAAKERLSRATISEIVVPQVGIEVHLTRHELESLATPALTEAVRLTNSVVGRLAVPGHRLAGVFLVGGSSRIPLLSTLLFQELGRAPVVIEQPELVVAEGSVALPELPPAPGRKWHQATGQPDAAPTSPTPAPTTPAAPPRQRRRRTWLRWLGPVALLPVAAVIVGLAVALITILAFVGMVVWSILTGQGFLPDWNFMPRAPWA